MSRIIEQENDLQPNQSQFVDAGWVANPPFARQAQAFAMEVSNGDA